MVIQTIVYDMKINTLVLGQGSLAITTYINKENNQQYIEFGEFESRVDIKSFDENDETPRVKNKHIIDLSKEEAKKMYVNLHLQRLVNRYDSIFAWGYKGGNLVYFDFSRDDKNLGLNSLFTALLRIIKS